MRTRSLSGKKTLAGNFGNTDDVIDSFFQGITIGRLIRAEEIEQKGLKSTSFGGWEMRVRVPSGAPTFSSGFGCSDDSQFSEGKEVKTLANTELQSVLEQLTQASNQLALAAGILADQTVPVGVPVKMPQGKAPPAEGGIAAAIAPGAQVSVPAAGLPAAQLLSRSAVPLAPAALMAANAVPVFAPLLTR